MSRIAPLLSRRHRGLLIALALSAGLPACAQTGGVAPGAAAPQAYAEQGRGMSPETAAARRADWLLAGLNVGEAERGRIRQIVQAAAADLAGQRDARRQLHQQSMRLFAAPVVDAAAAEQLRQQMVATHDRVTRRRLQMLLDISAVLTPEQRAAVLQRMQQRGGHMKHHGMHHGMHHGGGHPGGYQAMQPGQPGSQPRP